MRVVVIGAGVVGLCCAWYLRQDGHEVTVVDRGEPESDKCSLGNAGIIVPSHFIPLAAPGMVATGLKMMAKKSSPFRIKPSLDPALAKWCLLFMKHCTAEHVEKCAPVLRDLHFESKGLFQVLAKDWGNDFGLTEKGMLMLCKTPEGFHEEIDVAEHAKKLGQRAAVLSPEEVAQIETGVTTSIVGAVHFLDDCHLAPQTFLRRIQQKLEESGVSFFWNAGFQDWTQGRVATLKTTSGSVEADACVVAAGAWSGEVARSLGFDMPLQPGKGLNVTLANPKRTPEIAGLLKEARIAVTPMEGGVRFAGTMELGEWGLVPDRVRSQAMVANIPSYLPDFSESDFKGLPVWTGLRPCSPDGMPYIGRTRFAENVVFATGHGMMGVSLAPVTGKIVCDLLGGRPHPEELLSPDRFA